MDDYSILDAELPTMVVRCNNTLVLRSVITGQHLQVIGPVPDWTETTVPAAVRQKSQQIEQEFIKAFEAVISLIPYEHISKTSNAKPVAVVTEHNKSPPNLAELPPCKVQRNYCCTLCSYYTQNPRSHLLHQRDVHGIRLSIHGCQHCQYASRYCQKLKRHIKMVHTLGNSQEGVVKNVKPIDESIRNTKPATSTKNEASSNILKNTPPIIEPNVELPTCSKAVSAPQNSISVDFKKDPEAFFVSAYKNQLQKQLEHEQHLKHFAKAINTESNKFHKPAEVPKQPIEPHSLPTIPIPAKIDKPVPIVEKSKEIKDENSKKRMYSCRKCNYTTHIKSRYNKHVKYHSMPMIQCDKCEFRTTYKWNLTRHLRSHHSNGIYKCSVCSFSANMKQSLTSHEVNHHSPPVGRAVGNKPIRKRRCRVGGSDLLCENGNDLVTQNNEQTNTQSSSQSYSIQQGIDDSRKHDFNSNSNTSNENDSNKSEDHIRGPLSRDITDSDNSVIETSDSSDMDADSSGDSSTSTPENLTNPPIHIDADFLSNSAETQNYASFSGEQKILSSTCVDYSATTSGSNSSASTISADENSDRNSNASSDTSVQSSPCDSEDDNEYSSSMSTTSNKSFKETTDRNENLNEQTPLDNS